MPVHRVFEFDTWRPGYGSAVVTVFIAETTTKASLFEDEALTVAAVNPQTLDSQTINNITYGKFLKPLYTSSPYTLDIDSTDQTGIERPALISLVGEDASKVTVQATGGSTNPELEDVLARVIHAEDYGALGAAAATNNATLTAAIGAAAANGGGRVIAPGGTYPFTGLTLPAGVVIEGQGRGVTILECQTAGNCLTISGDRAGLARLTLDGVNLVAGGVGVFSKANDEMVFEDVDVKRFETGIHFKGGRRASWRDLYLTSCSTGAKLHGDNDAGGGADGDEFRSNAWLGGKVALCTTIGVELSYEDKKCYQNVLEDVGFENNTGTALKINGARYTKLPGCWWKGNTTDFAIQDDDDTTDAARRENTVIGLFFKGGSIVGGAATFTDTCQDVILEGMEIADVDFTLTVPVKNAILVLDCTEDSLVTIGGEGTKWTRFRSINKGASSGITTAATATKAWSIELSPGQVAYLEGKVIGNQRNGENTAEYHIAVSAERPGSKLDYDTQTTNFTLGEILTGQSSGATGRIVADADAGATGTLTLRDIDGTFVDNEIITDPLGGSATANGVLQLQNAALLGTVELIRPVREDVAGWDATFVANGPEVELRVTGAAAQTIEWLTHVQAVLS